MITLHGYTDEQREEFRALAEPLVKWLHLNGNPHQIITITQTGAELLCGEIGIPFQSPD
ncbi:MAG: hypothetical protein HGA87_01565 [Desulfobulbaceae bacterium]|nr:hypothetical protein [Desulfobulbaceae bacterium]